MFRWPVRDNVELRIPEERDAAELFALIELNRTRLQEWLHWSHSTKTREEVLEFIRAARRDFEKPNALHCLIFCRDRIAGVCSLMIKSELTRTAEIGYWIGKEWEGQGLVTDTCRALVSYAFDSLDLNRVQIRCAVGNTRSAAIPGRLGFHYEGRLRQTIRCGERLLDEDCYSILRSEWGQVGP